MDWTAELLDQLPWHWSTALGPRLEGLSDDEYRQEPVEDVWTVRQPAEGVREACGWIRGVRSLDASALSRPAGPAETPFDDRTMGTLVLHIHREVIHHGAEVALLRDLSLRHGRRPGTGF